MSGAKRTSRLRRLLPLCLALALSGLLVSCPPPKVPYGPTFTELSRSEAVRLARRLSPATQRLASWAALAPALEGSLAYARRQRPNRPAYDNPWLRLTWDQVRLTLEHLLAVLPQLDAAPEILGQDFVWRRIDPPTLLTGYYEPRLEASLTPDPGYPYPLYGPPPDLKTVDLGRFNSRWAGQTLVYRLGKSGIEPYHDRAEIDFGGALKGRGAEIAWVNDPVAVFLLHIQGSGRLVLPDGSSRHVLYGGSNGRDYVGLANVLIAKGRLTREEADMPGIRRFLEAHPELRQELLGTNPRYTFFRLADDGPFGATGAKLTPLVSVAVKPDFIPMGAPLVLEAGLPAEPGEQGHRLAGLVLAQDRGAMRDNHLDLFCGADEQAEYWAGRLRHQAAVHVLVSRQALPAEASGK